MKHRALFLVPLFFVASCARFPDGGSYARRFPRIKFHIQLRDQVDPKYIYIVAIRTIKEQGFPNDYPPLPIVNRPSDAGAGNGFVDGKPTHFVRYQADLEPYPYRLYKFFPDQDDPDAPYTRYDLANQRPPIVNFKRPTDPSYKNELNFDLFLNQLVDSDEDASQIKGLQINILTMTDFGNVGRGDKRGWDALGKGQADAEYLNLDLQINRLQENNEIEIPDDVTGDDQRASIDIVNFSLEVVQP